MQLKKNNIFEHTSVLEYLKEIYSVNVKRGKLNYDILAKMMDMSKMKCYYLFNGAPLTDTDITKIKMLLKLNKNEFQYLKILIALNNEHFPKPAVEQTLKFLSEKYLKLEKGKKL